MSGRSRAVANDRVAEQAAEDFLASGGSALGAVLAGFFAAAGAHAGVLLCPAALLVGGAGIGFRCFDGRLRQPGLGAKRPRGFRSGETVPDAAKVAVPTAVQALLVACTYAPGDRLGRVLRAGVRLAERAGSEARAALLQRIRAVGAAALTEASFVRPLLRAAGPSEGGLLTPADFSAVPEVDLRAASRRVGSLKILEPPWAREARRVVPDTSVSGIGCGVCAVDALGGVAGLVYRRVLDGFLVDDLELEAPYDAVPVQRGVTRIPPGARIVTPAPCALWRREGVDEVVVAPGCSLLDAKVIANPPLGLRRHADGQVEAVRRV